MILDQGAEQSAISLICCDPALAERFAPDDFADVSCRFAYEVLKECITRYGEVESSKAWSLSQRMKKRETELQKEYEGDFIQTSALEKALESPFDRSLRNTNYSQAAKAVKDLLVEAKASRMAVKIMREGIYRIEQGEDSLDSIVAKLDGARIKRTRKAKSLMEQVDTYEHEHNAEPLKTGLKEIDERGGISRGRIVLWGGDSGVQKTRSSLWVIVQILKNNPDEVAVYFEKEMQMYEVLNMLLAQLTGIENIHHGGDAKQEAIFRLRVMAGDDPYLHKLVTERLFLVDTNDFDSVEDMAGFIQDVNGTIFCLDYFTQMVDSATDSSAMTLKCRDMVLGIKRLVHRTNAIGFIIAQSKQGTIELRKNKVPLIEDMEWAGELKKNVAYAFMLFMPVNYYSSSSVNQNYYYICCRKFRDGPRKFTIPLLAKPQVSQFSVPDGYNNKDMERWIANYTNGEFS